ncbi:MAG: hypothetical protein RJB62_194 [Pseudomonadota bacterium]
MRPIGGLCCGQGAGFRDHLVTLLHRNDTAFGQRRGAVGIALSGRELRLHTGDLRFRLTEFGLRGQGVDPKKDIAFFDELAFLKFHRNKFAIGLRFNLDRRVGHHGADGARHDGNAARLGAGDAHRGGDLVGAARAALCAITTGQRTIGQHAADQQHARSDKENTGA